MRREGRLGVEEGRGREGREGKGREGMGRERGSEEETVQRGWAVRENRGRWSGRWRERKEDVESSGEFGGCGR